MNNKILIPIIIILVLGIGVFAWYYFIRPVEEPVVEKSVVEKMADPIGPVKLVFTKFTIDDDFDGAWSVHAVDLDGDGDQDVLGAAATADDIAWWRNDGKGVFTKFIVDDDFNNPNYIYTTDLDGDGDQDILGTSELDHDIAWWRNDGEGGFVRSIIIDRDWKDGGFKSVHATDLDRDGDQDILAAAWISRETIWGRNDGEGVFTEVIIDTVAVSSIYVSDFDGDGDQDILGGGEFVVWWRNDGKGVFTKFIVDDDDAIWSVEDIRVADIDRDGDQDVIGVVMLDDLDMTISIAWWRNDGEGIFTKFIISDDDLMGPASIYISDLDGDGYQDILGAVYRVHDIRWWRNDEGVFTEFIIDDWFGGATSVYATDLDGDGDQDVLGAASQFDDIVWWRNDGGY